MFSALKKYDRKTIQIIVSIILVVVLIFPPLANNLLSKAFASGSLTKNQVQINNSQAGATGVTYSFYWTTSATTAIKQIDIQVCDTPSGTCNAPSGFSSGTPTLVSDNIAGSGRTTSAPSGNAFRIVVGTPASQSTQTMAITFSGVTNPSTANTTSYARITTADNTPTTIDTGTSAFAVLDTGSIAVSATVDPNFTFTVTRAVTGSVNGDLINVSSTTNNSIPYGTLNTSVASVSAHDLTVTTNASNGYTITASSAATTQAGSPPLTSGTSDNIDTFNDSGASNASPTSWSAPAGSTPDVDTGYFGYTTNDSSLCTGTANRFTNGGPKYAGFTTTGQEVACSSVPVSSETTRFGEKLQINSIQPAGTYTGTIILVATPTY